MSPCRDRNVMLRLTPQEYATLTAARPAGENLASFARRTLLASLSPAPGPAPIREAAALIIAALSPVIDYDDALNLYDEHIRDASRGEAFHGGFRHEELG